MINLKELIPRAHQLAKDKGFWDEPRNQGECLMLAISELGEAQEAHRKGRTGDLAKYIADTNELSKNPQYAKFQPATFQELVKDTVGDELADAYIRLCDFAGGTDAIAEEVADWTQSIRAHYFSGPDNFGEALLEISDYVIMARTANGRAPHRDKAIAGALARIESLALRQGIDLETHINLKLAYNQSRERLHGKKY